MKFLFLSVLVLVTFTTVLGQDQAQKIFSEGVKLLKAEKFAEAEKKFTQALQAGENKNGLKTAYIYKAFALNGQKKYDEAVDCFGKAIEIDPLDPATYTDRAKTYSYKNDYEHAVLDFNKVLTIDSVGKQAEAACYYLGRIKLLQHKDREAIIHFDKLLKLSSQDAEGYYLRGMAKGNTMDIDGSIKDYDQAIKYNPDHMEAYANRGTQKINKLPTQEKTGKNITCLPGPCADLLKAKKLGDQSVDDLLFLYCRKCK